MINKIQSELAVKMLQILVVDLKFHFRAQALQKRNTISSEDTMENKLENTQQQTHLEIAGHSSDCKAELIWDWHRLVEI